MNNKTIVAVIIVAVIAATTAFVVYTEFYATSPTPMTPPDQSPTFPAQSPTSPVTSNPTPTPSSDTSGSSGGNQNVKPTPYYPLTVTDVWGTEVVIKSAPKRIVSLAPSITELVFAAGAGDQVVGVTDYCDYPYAFKTWIAAGNMSSIGGYWHPPIEPIIAVNPDLIFACGDGASDEAAVKLRALNYTVVVLNPITIQAIINDIELIGKATNHTVEATATINNLQTRINAVKDKVANITDKPNVCYMMGTTYAAGSGSFISDCITLAGGVNVFGDLEAAYPQVSREVVIGKNPDIIITSGSTKTFLNNTNWSTINAVINGKVYTVNNYNAYSRNGPRFIEALEDIASKIHPELFGTAP
ncbi:MAG: cobalamin-binding protein [Candidatus Bathyarchaeota archaeon]|nr:cobalamin-binding protein [Candidatus Termiticorpusculum sp.]